MASPENVVTMTASDVTPSVLPYTNQTTATKTAAAMIAAPVDSRCRAMGAGERLAQPSKLAGSATTGTV